MEQREALKRFVDRMVRAAKLDVSLYEEVEADQSATGQAMGVVVLSSVAAGVAVGGIVTGTIFALIGWCIWAVLTYLIGAKLFPEPETRADVGELLRTIGFSSSPGVIRVLGIIPPLTKIVFVVAWMWMLIAMVIAVKQALDYSSMARAVGVCFVGFVVQILPFLLLIMYFAPGG